MNKSASTMSAPISVAPSISKPAMLSPPAAVARVPAKVAFAPLKVKAVVVPDLIIKLPDVFEKDDEQIIESYIQEIYPETFENYKDSGKIYVSNIQKSIETIFAIFDLVRLSLTSIKEDQIQHDHFLINEEINLDERI